ncbi:MAG: response regulator, partial [Gammaproteobacteria bacterium]|nr:response regulator [Gammaproteobacteria bacterium]
MSDSITAILHQLREEFIKQLPARIRAIQDLYQLVTRYNDIRELHRLIHSLTGAAGTHGLSDLTETARELEIRFAGIINEAAMPDSHTREIIDRLLQQLVNLAAQPRQSDEAGISAPSINIANRQSPLIHIVEDDLEQAILLSRALESEGFRTVLFSAAEEFRTALQDEKAEKPAAVIMDMVFPEGDNVGSQLIAEFTAMQNSSVAVLVASVRDDLEARLSAFRAGACRYLTKPYNVSQLVGILDALTGRMPAEAYRILLVDDDPLLLETEAAILQAAGLQVMALSEPLQTLNMVESFNPDVIVLDVYMPYASGPELAAVLRERDNLLQTPILFLSSETDISRQLLALSLGGDDFLVKPIKPEHFVSAVTTRARRARQSKLVQKRLEMTLQEREREHAAVDRHAIVSITDAAGNIISVNDRFCRISGYTRDELLNSNHRMINSGQHPAEFFVNLWQTISAGKIWHGDICNRDKDGGLYWFATTITPYLDAAGAPYQYVAIRTDITSVKEHEKSLETLVESTIAETGQEFFNNAVKGLAKATGTRIAFIAETDPADPAICRIKAMWDGDHLVEQFTYQVAGTPCETLKENTTAVFAEKITGYFPHDSWLQENGIESYIGIALGDVQGRLLGHMAIMDGHPLVENQAHLSLMQLFAARVASEIERLQVEQAVEQTKERLRRG